jgi:tetratricopeptide (TPR) repeat protein
MGRPEESIQALDNALKIEPNDIDAMTMKAQALSALGRYEESASVFDRAMQIDPAEPHSQALPVQSKGNSSAPLALDGNSGVAAAIFDSSDELDEGELWI